MSSSLFAWPCCSAPISSPLATLTFRSLAQPPRVDIELDNAVCIPASDILAVIPQGVAPPRVLSEALAFSTLKLHRDAACESFATAVLDLPALSKGVYYLCYLKCEDNALETIGRSRTFQYESAKAFWVRSNIPFRLPSPRVSPPPTKSGADPNTSGSTCEESMLRRVSRASTPAAGSPAKGCEDPAQEEPIGGRLIRSTECRKKAFGYDTVDSVSPFEVGAVEKSGKQGESRVSVGSGDGSENAVSSQSDRSAAENGDEVPAEGEHNTGRSKRVNNWRSYIAALAYYY